MQLIKSNLHTHTCLCDGKDTPEDVVKSAIAQGMNTLGFSGHSYVPFDLPCCMNLEETAQYRAEIPRLKKLYGDQLNILMGIEQDYYTTESTEGYEYIIGSVHYLLCDGTYYPLDQDVALLKEMIDRHFGGDIYRFLKVYYEMEAGVVEKTGCQIIGHFDLVSKFNEVEALFDPTDPRYLRYAMDSLDALLEKDVVFEINTGAISRGYRRTPYPAPVFLRRILEKGGRITFNSDSHQKETLLFAMEDAVRYAKSAGVGSLEVMTEKGWRTCPI